MTTQHTHLSSYRERLIEHLFLGELLKLSWHTDGCSLEIAKPEVDNSGYDVVAEAQGIVRHVQLKTSVLGGGTKVQNVHMRLASKPSGCVVWIYFHPDTLQLGPFLYFGGETPGAAMPSLAHRKTAVHSKWSKDADTEAASKAQRPNLRVLPKGSFTRFDTVAELYQQLFGPAPKASGGRRVRVRSA